MNARVNALMFLSLVTGLIIGSGSTAMVHHCIAAREKQEAAKRPVIAPPQADQVYADISEQRDTIFGKRYPVTTIWSLESQRHPYSFSDELDVVVSYKADFGETRERGLVLCRYHLVPVSDGHEWVLDRVSLLKREVKRGDACRCPERAPKVDDDEAADVQTKAQAAADDRLANDLLRTWCNRDIFLTDLWTDRPRVKLSKGKYTSPRVELAKPTLPLTEDTCVAEEGKGQ